MKKFRLILIIVGLKLYEKLDSAHLMMKEDN